MGKNKGSRPLPIKCNEAKKVFNSKFAKRDCTGFLDVTTRGDEHDTFQLFIKGEKQIVFASFSRGPRHQVHGDVPRGLGINRKYCIDMFNCHHTLDEFLKTSMLTKDLLDNN